MSILTGLVIVVAMATLAQRSDSLLDFFLRDPEPKVAPQNDAVAMFAGESRVIDVLANDENATTEDHDRIRILVSPSCGAAEATPSGVLYISNDSCVGPQLFAYCVARGDECPSASVTVEVAPTAPYGVRYADRTTPAAPPTPAPEPETTPGVASSGEIVVPASRVAAASPQITDAGVAPRTAPQTTLTPERQFGDNAVAAQPSREAVAAAVRPLAPTQSPGRVASPPVLGGADDEAAGALAVDPLALAQEPTIDLAAKPAEPAVGGDTTVAALDLGAEDDAVAPRIDVDAPDIETATGDLPDTRALKTAPQTPQTEVARLKVPEAPAAARVQTEAIQTLREAPAAAPSSEPSSRPAPEVAGCGPVEVESAGVAGGSSVVKLSSPCRAGEEFAVEHAGLRFGGRLDAGGAARVNVPVLDASGAARALMADGTAAPVTLIFNLREVESTLRVAVAWTAPVDLNIHAFEYAAPFGGDGHVWEGRPRGFRSVRRSGGGFLASYPAVGPEDQSIEVYTFWANRRARRGVTTVTLDHASRGDFPEGAYCDQGALASPEYVVVRSERGEVTSRSRGRFAPAACGLALNEEARYASGVLGDLRIE